MRDPLSAEFPDRRLLNLPTDSPLQPFVINSFTRLPWLHNDDTLTSPIEKPTEHSA